MSSRALRTCLCLIFLAGTGNGFAVPPEGSPFPVLDEIPSVNSEPKRVRIPRPRRVELEPWKSIPTETGIQRVARRNVEEAVRIERREPAPSFPSTTISLLLVGDMTGAWVEPQCGKPESTSPLRALQGNVGAAFDKAHQLGLPKPVLIQTGNDVGGHPFSRFLREHSPALWTRFATLLKPTLYVPGNGEALLPAPALSRLRETLGDRFFAVNAQFKGEKNPLGASVSNGYTMITPSGVPIALIPIALGIDDSSTGLTASRSPFREVSRAASHARKFGGAALVIGVASLGEVGDSTHKVVQFGRRLQGVDLLLTGVQGDPIRGYGVREIRFQEGGSPPILSRTGEITSPTPVLLDVVHQGGKFVFSGARIGKLWPSPPEARIEENSSFEEARKSYCSSWGAPLSMQQDAPIDGEDWMSFTVESARWRAKAEIGVLSRQDLALAPLSKVLPPITRDTVERLHPNEVRLHQVTVRGDQLAPWLEQVVESSDALMPRGPRVAGAKVENGEIIINGRVIQPSHTYSLILSDRILKGESIGAPPLPSDWIQKASQRSATLRNVLLEGIQSQKQNVSTSPSSVPFGEFPDLKESIQWKGQFDTNLGFKWTAVENPSGETQEPQLTREPYLGLDSTTTARLDAESLFHEWANRVELQFATSQAGREDFSESKDLTTIETLYSWLQVKNGLGNGSAAMPVPFGRLRTETELTKPRESAFRHLEVTLSTGARWLFDERTRLSLGVGVGGEVLDPVANAPMTTDVALEVLRTPLDKTGQVPVFFEGRTDILLKRPGSMNSLKLISSAKLAYAWTPYLALTLGAEFFGFSNDNRPFSWSADAMLGIQGYFSGHAQEFPTRR